MLKAYEDEEGIRWPQNTQHPEFVARSLLLLHTELYLFSELFWVGKDFDK